jgi:hypothetical protein
MPFLLTFRMNLLPKFLLNSLSVKDFREANRCFELKYLHINM